MPTCVRPRTWAEVSSPQNTDSAQERRGFPPVQSRMASTSPHETLSNQGKDYLRAPTPPQKGRVFPLSNQRGTDITPQNPVQSGQRLPQRTDDPTLPGEGIRIAGLPLVFAGVGLKLSEKKGVAVALGVCIVAGRRCRVSSWSSGYSTAVDFHLSFCRAITRSPSQESPLALCEE